MREDVGEVTTSLHRPTTDSSRSTPVRYDSFEWPQQQQPPPSNGVPRSAWNRQHRRLSRWHRPFTAVLIVLDLLSALGASKIADAFLEKSKSGFLDKSWLFLHGTELFGF